MDHPFDRLNNKHFQAKLPSHSCSTNPPFLLHVLRASRNIPIWKILQKNFKLQLNFDSEFQVSRKFHSKLILLYDFEMKYLDKYCHGLRADLLHATCKSSTCYVQICHVLHVPCWMFIWLRFSSNFIDHFGSGEFELTPSCILDDFLSLSLSPPCNSNWPSKWRSLSE